MDYTDAAAPLFHESGALYPDTQVHAMAAECALPAADLLHELADMHEISGLDSDERFAPGEVIEDWARRCAENAEDAGTAEETASTPGAWAPVWAAGRAE